MGGGPRRGWREGVKIFFFFFFFCMSDGGWVEEGGGGGGGGSDHRPSRLTLVFCLLFVNIPVAFIWLLLLLIV